MLLPYPTEMGPFLPFYHTVSDTPLPYIRHLYRVRTTREFLSNLDYMLRHFKPVTPEELHLPAKGKTPMVLSFDDGLRGCYEVVAPVLERKGIPAIFFVNSAFVDNKDLFFRFKASLLADELLNKPTLLKEFHIWGNTLPDVRKALMAAGYEDRQSFDQTAGQIGVNFRQFLDLEQPFMTLQQLLDLDRRGFSIGAHSHSHPHFHRVDIVHREDEVRLSVQFIREHFPGKPVYFSFPFTDYGMGDDFLRSLTDLFDIRYSFGCAGLKRESVPTHFQRVAMEQGQPAADKILQHANIGFYLKRLVGKHRVNRQAWN
jgi:peptidoglycan/xylan/chitin deacetylase (PgdA/CDA1 family)